jgi:hypothetical protein
VGHTGVASFKLVKDRVGIVYPARLDIGKTEFDCSINGREAAFALLHQAECSRTTSLASLYRPLAS